MKKQLTEFWLIPTTKQTTKNLPRVTAQDIFLPSSNTFHPDGLFSTEIFGELNTPERMNKYAVIDLNCKIITPLLYIALTKRKAITDIIYGRSYWKFDSSKGDFIESTPEEGDTGISFFIEHVKDLNLDQPNPSAERVDLIKTYEKYKKRSLVVEQVYVLEAGIRDYEIGSDGRATQDEINNIYRAILQQTQMLPETIRKGDRAYDSVIVRIQELIIELFKYIATIKDGKHKFTRKKFAARHTHGTTRNILTASEDDVMDSLDADIQEIDQVQLGLFQYIKSIKDKGIYQVLNCPIVTSSKDDRNWFVVDKETLHKREATTTEAFYYSSRLANTEGVNKFIDSFKNINIRDMPVGDDTSYLALIYDNPKDPNIYILHDIDELKEGLKKKHVRPLTLTDLLVISVFENDPPVIATNTRYPVDNPGSAQLNRVYIKVKNPSRNVTVHLDNINTKQIERYPVQDGEWINGITPPSSGIAPFGGDYDGDASTLRLVLSEEAVAQGRRIISPEHNIAYFKNADGSLKFSPSDSVSEVVFAHLG